LPRRLNGRSWQLSTKRREAQPALIRRDCREDLCFSFLMVPDHAIIATERRNLKYRFAWMKNAASKKIRVGMTRIGKFAAVVLSLTIFAMPAAAMPLHCFFMAPSGGSAPGCQMMGMGASPDNVKATPSNRSCCEVSAARPQPFAVPQVPLSNSITPAASQSFLSDLPAAPPAHGSSDWITQSPGVPPQAVLCTFLI
jgi:hypothetical protein